jgi:hypothetical protein
MPQTLGPQSKGVDRDYQLTIRDSAGQPVGAFTLASGLSAVIWAGDDTAVLATPAVSWLNPAVGTIKLTISAGNLAPTEPGTYHLVVKITDDARVFTAFDGYIAVDPAPGVASAGPVYCDFRDMLTYYAAVGQLQAASDQAGFAEARARARTWFDNAILRRYVPSNQFASTVGFGPPFYGVQQGVGGSVAGRAGRSKWLRDQLAANLLMVTDTVKEINAKKAISIVCGAQIGSDGKRTGYQDVGDRFSYQAEHLMFGYAAELDLNGDGYPDITVNMGVASVR